MFALISGTIVPGLVTTDKCSGIEVARALAASNYALMVTLNPSQTYSFVAPSIQRFRSCVVSGLRWRFRKGFVATRFFLSNDLAHQGSADPVCFSHLVEADALGSIPEQCWAIDLSARSAQFATFAY